MLRSVSIVLVVLGLIALATPPALGVIYEQQVRSEFESGPSNPLFTVELADYERGLYASTATLRFAYSEQVLQRVRDLPMSDPSGATADPGSQAVADALAKLLSGDIRYNVDIRHGPVVTGDGLKLALASLRVDLDATTGTLAEVREQAGLPYLMRGEGIVGFDNVVDFRTTVPAIGWKGEDDSAVGFSGFEASGSYDRKTGGLIVDGLSAEFEIESELGAMRASGIGLDFDGRLISDYLWLGESSFSIASVEAYVATGADNLPIQMNDIDVGFDAIANQTGDKVSMAISYGIGDFTGIPGMELADMELAIELTDIDLEVINAYAELNQRMFLATPEEISASLPEFENLALRMLQGSPGFSIETARFILNGQRFVANAGIDLDAAALPPDLDIGMLQANPALLIDGLSAQGQIEAAEPLAMLIVANVVQGQIRSSLSPDAEIDEAELQAVVAQQSTMLLDGLVQQGFVDRARGALSTQFRIVDGVLLVNGKPIPLGGVEPASP